MLKSLNLKTIVVKVGTKVLTGRGYHLDKASMKNLVEQVSAIVKKGVRVVIVSSGAIVSGMGLLKLNQRPKQLSKLQACAAVGQPHLMRTYDDLFRPHGIITSQILLTWEDLSDRKRYLNAKTTIETLLAQGVVPIVNENDTVSAEEIKFGDNDKLASLVANLIGADLLVLLSDVAGLYRYAAAKKSDAGPISVVDKITEEIESLARKGADGLGQGGMVSKLKAARIATLSGVSCIIADGRKTDILRSIIINKEREGTLFLSASVKLGARKCWLGFGARTKGHIQVDDGAREALVRQNRSLLASGVIAAHGDFKKGDCVGIVDVEGREFARGVVNYTSSVVAQIKGLKTAEISGVLGQKDVDEVVHKDNLVIL